ncbi:MAG: glycosyltransferase family 4 protein [bacterium]
MKICRIAKHLPRVGVTPVEGLHPYFLTALIEEDTLVLTKKYPAQPRPLPSHAQVVEISYKDIPFSDYMENETFVGGKKSIIHKIKFIYRTVSKFREVSFLFKCMPALLRYRPDIVHCHAFITILPGIFSKIFLRSKLIVTLHSSVDAVMLKKSRFLRSLLNFADKIFCVSTEIKRELLPFYSENRFEITPNGVDLSLFRNQSEPRENRLIAVGTFRWYKGYKYLVRAMKIIVEKYPDYTLIICGGGLERQQVEDEIRRLSLEQHISITGMITQEKIAELLNRSRIFVMSSVVEGLPKALIEALACGTPAVITTACAAEDAAENTALVVEPKNPAAFADAVSRLISDPQLYKRLADACPDAVKKYDWRNIADSVKQIYSSLLSQ